MQVANENQHIEILKLIKSHLDLDSRHRMKLSIKPHLIENYLYTTVSFVAAVFIFYGETFKLWANQLMGFGPDGAKNFYTLAYHISKDDSSFWFKGMNYPYGEHLLYTDNQPLIANVLRLLNHIFPIESHLLIILPLIIFSSYLFGALILSRIIHDTGVKPWFSALSSVGIMLLSPQLVRLSGHYSLSYGVIIPLVIGLMYSAYKNQSIKSWIALLIALYLSGFIHPYFIAMASMFVFAFRVVVQWDEHRMLKWKPWLQTVIFSFGAMVLFQLTIALTDSISDRPASPYGFLVYRATLSSIFLPVAQWYMEPISAIFPWLDKRAAEGNFYIGIFAVFSVIWTFIKVFKLKFGNWFSSLSVTRKFGLFILIASLPILLLSIGFPFILPRMEGLLDYSGPLRQFRGIGRFSFVFFYAINLFAAIELAHFYQSEITKRSTSIVTLLIGLLWYEVYSYKTHIIDYTSHGSTIMNGQFWSEAKIDSDEFQAIMPLPYFHTGSENFRTDDKQENIAPAFALSQETGLPLTAVQMSRTSLSQTMNQLQLHRLLLKNPSVLNQYNDKDLLLMVDQRIVLEGYQMQLVYHSEPFFKKEGFELRRLPVSAFTEILKETEQKFSKWQSEAQLLSSSFQNETIYYQSLDDSAATNSFKNGAWTFTRDLWTDLIPEKTSLIDSTVYELSFWFDASEQNAVNTQVWQWNYVNDEEVNFNLAEVGDFTRAVVGNWILVVIPIEDFGNKQTTKVTLHRDGNKMPITVDEILLKPALLHTTISGGINVNNRFLSSVN